jgi:hypothetical protein
VNDTSRYNPVITLPENLLTGFYKVMIGRTFNDFNILFVFNVFILNGFISYITKEETGAYPTILPVQSLLNGTIDRVSRSFSLPGLSIGTHYTGFNGHYYPICVVD